ncbi:hypothetical protein H6F90_00060 [Trichocoleus sp. FACHB-591]|uniref:hypothetical protein n=1 Tax=Trichocoleus sp. FACHB-591 TaxID=2692872 RepID=UPI001688AB7B|nr:hypothetical protein [Trichocoleus sp. FACHB-591]MBD2093550.1 hypothetical protein [Trichocoleus sp. FACHB-591]
MRQLVLFTCAAIATLALTSCGFSQKTIESKLASIDTQPSAEKQYAALLDELDSKCQEDGQAIADLTVRAVELVKQADKEANNLQMGPAGAFEQKVTVLNEGLSC